MNFSNDCRPTPHCPADGRIIVGACGAAPMSRRSFCQVRKEGASAERRATVTYLRQRSLTAERAARRSPLCSDEEARLLRDRLDAMADEIELGLHL
jgi:hypothetical protein